MISAVESWLMEGKTEGKMEGKMEITSSAIFIVLA